MRVLLKEYPSRSSSDIHKVHQDDQTGKIDCSCRGWRFSGNDRGCCHTKDILENHPDLLVVKIVTPTQITSPSATAKIAKKKALDASSEKALTGLTVPGLVLPYYKPMLAKESTPEYIEERMENDEWIAEEKFDGCRYLCYVTTKGNRFFSRRISVKDNMPVEKTDNVPHLRDYKGFEVETILDGEILPATGAFTDTTKIMGSLPEEAIEKQKTLGKVIYRVFDILYYKGVCVMDKPLSERIGFLKSLSYNDYFLAVNRVVGAAKRKLLKDVYARGGEGIILKRLDGKYKPGVRDKDTWMKVKRSRDYDVVVMGYDEPEQFSFNVKGEKTINKHWQRKEFSAIKFGTYKNGQLIKVGQCSGMDDETRATINKDRQKYIGLVMVVEGKGFLVEGIRHPQFVRFRDDKLPKDCLYEDILD